MDTLLFALAVFFSLLRFAVYCVLPIFQLVARIVRRKPLPKPDFNADIVLVTGGAQGLGREIALRFADSGATVVLWDINEEKVHATCQELIALGHEAFSYRVDCSKKEEIFKTAQQVREEVGNVSVLVNNAGTAAFKMVTDMSDTDAELTYAVNTLSHFWTAQAFLPWMIENDYGYIVTISSVSAYGGFALMSDYCSSKSASIVFAESLRAELKKKRVNGVSVTCVCPWHMGTELFAGFKTNLHWLFPTLKVEDVAGSVLRSTADKSPLVFLPWYFYGMILLKFTLPTKAFDELSSILIGDHMMDNVRKGRKS